MNNLRKDFGNAHTRKPDITSLVFGKIPPQAPQLEEAVLGACMLERDKFNTVAPILPDGEYFYVDAHQKIWEAMRRLEITGNPIDLLTVTEQLRKSNNLDIIGGAYFLIRLTMNVSSSAHVEAHARVVAEKYMSRRLITLCGKLIGDAYEDTGDVFDMLTDAQIQLSKINESAGGATSVSVGRVFIDVMQELEGQKNAKTALTGLDTGIRELNEITNGWKKSNLIVIGARPSKGKTALSLNLAVAAAMSQLVKGVPVLFLSLEMCKEELVKRIISTVTGIDYGKIDSGRLTDDEFTQVTQQTAYFNSLPIHIVDDTREWGKLVPLIRKMKAKHGIGMIIGDYIGLVKNKATEHLIREQQVSYMSGDSKSLAKELELPFIWLSQLNRNVEGRGKGEASEPQPSDLRESGSLEQDADIIIFPWHSSPTESWISVAKNRNGKVATGTFAIKMNFIGSIQKWVSANESSPFEETIRVDNPRAGIVPHYEARLPYKEDEAPF